MELLYLIVGIIIGFILAYLMYKKNNNTATDAGVLEKQLIDLEKQKIVADTNFANAEKEKLQSQQEVKQVREQFASELKVEKESSFLLQRLRLAEPAFRDDPHDMGSRAVKYLVS